jgi:hypothetical protein
VHVHREIALGDAPRDRGILLEVLDHVSEGVAHLADLVTAADVDLLFEVAARDAAGATRT